MSDAATLEPVGLRQKLIEAGMALLNEGGPAALTLRRAAARAGVSHAAPAHHFAGLPGLMTAIATEAFWLFSSRMVAERAKAAPLPFARLLAICEGYLDFAERHAGLFHTMFLAAEPNRADPALAEAGEAAYNVLRDGCRPFAGSAAEAAELEAAVWSLVHGYALLGFRDPHVRRGPAAETPPFAPLLRRLVGAPPEAPHETRLPPQET